jgi:hypothetical protein
MFLFADFTIIVGINTSEPWRITNMFHLTTLGCHFTHLFGMCGVEFLLNDFTVTIKIEVSESRHIAFHAHTIALARLCVKRYETACNNN